MSKGIQPVQDIIAHALAIEAADGRIFQSHGLGILKIFSQAEVSAIGSENDVIST